MKKGGYQILDLSAVSFRRGQSQIVKGAHELIEGTRKVILVSGLEVDGVEYRDAFVNFTIESGSFVGSMYDVSINIGASVDGNDPITITGV